MREKLLALGEYAAAALYEEADRSLFYRKALALRRYYEYCELYEWNNTPLYPSGTVKQKMRVIPNFFHGLTFFDSKLREEDPDAWNKIYGEFMRYHSSVPIEHTVAGNMYTHSMPNYERIAREGLLSYLPRIEKIEDADMREGLCHLVRGIETYVGRCVDYLTAKGADKRLVEGLARVPLYPARNIYEAILSRNFVMYLDGCDNLGPIEEDLAPYFHGENVVELLENLYSNLDLNNGYSASLTASCPALCIQALEAATGKRRPMLELLIDENTPNEVWEAALKLVRSGGGQPAFYNKNRLLGGLKERFPTLRKEDLRSFCGGGCTESMIGGYSAVGSYALCYDRTLRIKITVFPRYTA